MVWVELAGPPLVRPRMMSSTLSVYTTPSTRTTLTTGRSMGQVMCRKAFHPVAPSRDPASYSSSGISCSPP
ncbi:hypothetical protein D3C73_1369150 [compost metagenome]